MYRTIILEDVLTQETTEISLSQVPQVNEKIQLQDKTVKVLSVTHIITPPTQRGPIINARLTVANDDIDPTLYH